MTNDTPPPVSPDEEETVPMRNPLRDAPAEEPAPKREPAAPTDESDPPAEAEPARAKAVPEKEAEPEQAETVPEKEAEPEQAETVPEKQAEPAAEAEPGRARKLSSAGLLIGLLLALFGFTLVVQLRSNDDDSQLASMRQDDLVRILSDLEARDQRLQQEIAALDDSRRQLTSDVGGREEAIAEAGKRADELGLLSGTVPARGPGLVIKIAPDTQAVKASAVLNAVQELRGAGGEVMQLVGDNGVAVRVVASSYFVDAAGGDIIADGQQLTGPYTLSVIGVAGTMETALRIPGGVVASVSQAGGNVTMEQRATVEVTAVRQAASLQYARPVS
ncbi:DUF881 domain-containing protein [Symbioplanes lichenis]|uniref:DUF881 domain-containing protein n=1 Tax=Symbioplanes lichenis TaxID=1629072 RepID=UPI00273929F4|nr:DUF881 domain-containing protein [Actinoplanes lichenis]